MVAHKSESLAATRLNAKQSTNSGILPPAQKLSNHSVQIGGYRG
jgi:hypothetical protein